MKEQKTISRRKQQFGGLFICVVSLIGIVITWYMALSKDYFYTMPSAACPAFLFVGLGLIIFPDYKAERIARGEDISELSGTQLLTVRWWVILAIGLLAGFGNFLLLKFF